MVKPIWKRPEDEISQRVEEKVKVDLDTRIKNEVDKIVNEKLKEREEKEKTDKASKLAKAVDVAKALKGEGEDKEKIEKEKKIAENDILCPTCHQGHVHKLESDKSGLVYKCHGDKCGLEHIFIPKNSDYKCVGCGMPLRKPEDPKSMDGCPFCHGSKAVKFDWGKIWAVTKK
jgi:hypothetical protein